MFEDFLNHKCDIYHAIRKPVDVGFGVASGFRAVYNDTPDITSQRCHASVKGTGTLSQGDPFNSYNGRLKLTVPYGTDIRVNDKVYLHEMDMEFVAEIPRNVQEHHKFVYIKRFDGTGEYL